MPHALKRITTLSVLTALLAATSCATLQQVVQPPTFDLARQQESQVRLLGPSLGRPLGGAEIRVWARVANPNPVGFTLSRLTGTVLLGNQPAADVDLPLGLPLEASGDTIIPLNLTISFADVPELADRIQEAITRGSVNYALRGILAVDAGAFGEPTFGPTTWLQGDVALVR